MTTSTARLKLVFGLALFVTACARGGALDEDGSVNVVAQALTVSDVSRVTVTISGSGIAVPIVADLGSSNGQWTATIAKIPAGTNRTFLAQAFDSTGAKRYQGQATGVTIAKGPPAMVAIVAQQIAMPTAYRNAAPVDDSLTASASTVAPGDTISLAARAHDPNPTDSLTYAWTAPGGAFDNPSSPTVTWTAPSTEGNYSLLVTITDPHGASSSMAMSVVVLASAATAPAQVSVGLNTSPEISVVTANPTQIDVGRSTALAVVATDADGDQLACSWSSSCAGTFSSVSASAPSFTLASLPSGGSCTLHVSVSDGRGGSNFGEITISTGPGPMPILDPQITNTVQSTTTANPRDTVQLSVQAYDPQGSALTFSWSSSTGTLSMPMTTSSSSQVVWTMDAACDTGSIAVSVSNALGASASATFAVTCAAVTCSPSLSVPDMPTARYSNAAVRGPDGRIYLIGGGKDTLLTEVDAYDPCTNMWSVVAPLPTPRYWPAAAVGPDGRIYVMGGSNGPTGYTTVEAYDVRQNTWTTVAPMGTARAEFGAALGSDGRIYAVGGAIGGSGAETATAEAYTASTNSWAPVASMAQARAGNPVVADARGAIVAVGGGLPDCTGLGSVESYDPSVGAWTTLPSLPSPQSNTGAGVLGVDGRLYSFGGEVGSNSCQDGAATDAFILDETAGTWSSGASMPLAVRAAPAATGAGIGAFIYVFGGISNGAPVATVQAYDPARNVW
jgi:hypothetical protein